MIMMTVNYYLKLCLFFCHRVKFVLSYSHLHVYVYKAWDYFKYKT